MITYSTSTLNTIGIRMSWAMYSTQPTTTANTVP